MSQLIRAALDGTLAWEEARAYLEEASPSLPSPYRQLFQQAMRAAQASPDAWREVVVLIAAAFANDGYAFAAYAPLLVKAAIHTLQAGKARGEPRMINTTLPKLHDSPGLDLTWTYRRLHVEVSLPPDVPSAAVYSLLLNVEVEKLK